MPSYSRSLRSGSHLVLDTHAALPFILEQALTHSQPETTKRRRLKIQTVHTSKPVLTEIDTDHLKGVGKHIKSASSSVEPTLDCCSKYNDRPQTKEPKLQGGIMSPIQPLNLPPSYIMEFVRGVFTDDLCLVDFTQALNAMDYLKELEARRRREMSGALERLGLEPSRLDRDREVLRRDRPGVAEWVAGLVDKAKRVESLYTQVYIGLRRWTLINEMRLEPFKKTNCIAMLNTLYPATYSAPPTSQLTPMLLNSQRNAFFRYILAVESNGKEVLQKLEQQGKRASDANAWPIVRDIVDKYLRTSTGLIQECTNIISEKDIGSSSAGVTSEKRTDSGVSFGSAKANAIATTADHDVHPAHRPSTMQANYLDIPQTPRSSSATPAHRRNNSSGTDFPFVKADALRQKEVRKVGSTLERLARELKRMRSRSNEGRDDGAVHYADRPRSRSRGPSDASQNSGSNYSADSELSADPFTVAAAPLPLPPMTATTTSFPDWSHEDDQVAPLPKQARPRGLKKMKSAGNITSAGTVTRENTMTGLKQGLSMERKGSGQGLASGFAVQSVQDRKYSAPAVSAGDFVVSEEQRRELIARARAEKENLGLHPSERRHSPIESRVDALLNGGYGAASHTVSALNFDLMSDMPVRRSSPGRNKLRDFYGVSNFEVPTNIAHC